MINNWTERLLFHSYWWVDFQLVNKLYWLQKYTMVDTKESYSTLVLYTIQLDGQADRQRMNDGQNKSIRERPKEKKPFFLIWFFISLFLTGKEG